LKPAEVRAFAGALRDNVAKAVVGRVEAVELMIAALLAGGHVLVEDLPGTGKTTLCRALAASLDCRMGRIQCTPDLMPADVTGVNVYDAASGSFRFREGPLFAHVVLADEINRATPRAQSALLEAMQEQQVSVDGETRALPSPFLVVATQNPVEMEGTFPLPEAQLDRFLLRIALGIPDRREEAALLERYRGRSAPPALAPVATREALAQASRAVEQVRVQPPARDYLLDLLAATRADARLALGASPRAALALQAAAQAAAALAGRAFVVPDDVKRMAVPVLAHRLAVEPSAALRGLDAARIVRDLLDTVPVEREDGRGA